MHILNVICFLHALVLLAESSAVQAPAPARSSHTGAETAIVEAALVAVALVAAAAQPVACEPIDLREKKKKKKKKKKKIVIFFVLGSAIERVAIRAI
jgi:hypothetical protein